MTDPNSEVATGATADPGRTRGRLILIALFVLFFGSAFGRAGIAAGPPGMLE